MTTDFLRPLAGEALGETVHRGAVAPGMHFAAAERIDRAVGADVQRRHPEAWANDRFFLAREWIEPR
ncbi:MAG: hypothetical protein KDA41_19455 [Planctomycetales bacterium]|nr:hypothetical protein [Planctomycetales bacterium]